MKKIILTGGGTAGHVNPNIALIPSLKKENYDISYIGSINGIEKDLISSISSMYDIEYHGISSGKLRRYIDLKNITDAFRVVKGVGEAVMLIKKLKPDVIFSKGGFVSVPVVIAGYLNKVPIIIHESDISTGLANKICIPLANKVCTTFPEALEGIPKSKGILTGTPIRQELFNNNVKTNIKFFSDNKPIILIMGGSLGSVKINNAIRDSLPELLTKFNIIHLCGKGNLDDSLKNKNGYIQKEYVTRELPDFFKACTLVVSRAGSNAICELLALKKPNLLIPLSKNASRGDQILNANSFKKQNYSSVLQEEDLTKDSLLKEINDLYNNRDSFIKSMQNSKLNNAIDKIIYEIKNI
ncbi:MAG: undecaprenyldiphospho-muramoylpentapeptide beta-N-acetylglucosaminyltransferase [bacterium]